MKQKRKNIQDIKPNQTEIFTKTMGRDFFELGVCFDIFKITIDKPDETVSPLSVDQL